MKVDLHKENKYFGLGIGIDFRASEMDILLGVYLLTIVWRKR